MHTVEETLNNHVNGWAGVLKTYFGLTDTTAMLALMGVIFVVGLVLFYVVRPIILTIVNRMADREKSIWMKAAYQNFVFHRVAWFIPGIVALVSVPIVASSTLPLALTVGDALLKGAEIYMVGVGAAVLSALLNAAAARFRALKFSRKYSINSYVQVLKIILFLLSAIVMVSIVIDQSPMYLLTGLGAMTAVIMLIFRDSILGFVASIQLSAYDMVRVGDWIEMPKYGADGTVTDISLNTIKIQNFDKTIVTVPSYTILTEGVKNWRGMSESGGRRIKRHITINVNSIKLCSSEMIARLSQLPLLKGKLEQHLKDDNRHVDADAVGLLRVDSRCLTNLALYRFYLEAYLASHPCVNPQMSFLIRELQNVHYGVPVEVYIFLNITEWAKYESIQSDIFDYLYAVMPLFELTAYQYESETSVGFEKGIA